MAPVLLLFYIQAAIESMDRDWPVPKPEFYFKADSQLTGRPYTARVSVSTSGPHYMPMMVASFSSHVLISSQAAAVLMSLCLHLG